MPDLGGAERKELDEIPALGQLIVERRGRKRHLKSSVRHAIPGSLTLEHSLGDQGGLSEEKIKSE